MPVPPTDRPRNRILATIPPEDYVALAPSLERVEMDFKRLLFDVDRPIEHVYFPETCVASILSLMADGSAVETATAGREGVVGLPVFLRTNQASAQAFVQISGSALRMEADAFRSALDQSRALSDTMHRYTQALFTLVAQGSACNRLHAMRERCARWLLHTHDRVERDDFPLTHQFLSQMIGVRRATVTEGMSLLQESGAIMYQMGRVHVLDRTRLEAEACECYTIIVREFDRLLGGPNGSPRHVPSVLGNVKTSEGGKSTAGEAAPRGADDGN